MTTKKFDFDDLEKALSPHSGLPNNSQDVMVRFGKAPNKYVEMIKRKNFCQFCRKNHETKLRTCGRCNMVRYCNDECKNADWKNHKNYCSDLNKCGDTPTFDIFIRDFIVHRRMTKYIKQPSAFDSKSRVWAYHSEDETGYMISLWTTPLFIDHLKKLGLDDKKVKWYVQNLLDGMSFIIYKEGQVAKAL